MATALAVIKERVDRIDYIEIRDAGSLRPIEPLDQPAVVLVAIYVGPTRLIDTDLTRPLAPTLPAARGEGAGGLGLSLGDRLTPMVQTPFFERATVR